jgi:uncharacterized damage-inducible protein DinB
MGIILKPQAGEFPAYAAMYIDLIPNDGRLLQHLEYNYANTRKLVQSIPEIKLKYRYAEGKWTIKEILVHITDDERIYAYRSLRFARKDSTELPGFEQEEYAANSGANGRSIESILHEFETVRKSTISLFENFTEEMFTRSGIANGYNVSVRALGYHIAGHEKHHINIIKERYLD